jgi:hypothetical protein
MRKQQRGPDGSRREGLEGRRSLWHKMVPVYIYRHDEGGREERSG